MAIPRRGQTPPQSSSRAELKARAAPAKPEPAPPAPQRPRQNAADTAYPGLGETEVPPDDQGAEQDARATVSEPDLERFALELTASQIAPETKHVIDDLVQLGVEWRVIRDKLRRLNVSPAVACSWEAYFQLSKLNATDVDPAAK